MSLPAVWILQECFMLVLGAGELGVGHAERSIVHLIVIRLRVKNYQERKIIITLHVVWLKGLRRTTAQEGIRVTARSGGELLPQKMKPRGSAYSVCRTMVLKLFRESRSRFAMVSFMRTSLVRPRQFRFGSVLMMPRLSYLPGSRGTFL